MTRYRIYCELCQKGLVRDLANQGAKTEFVDFMIGHISDYSILAAHKKNSDEPHRPRFALALAD